jgi:uncharacterized protein YbjT (DUF2867 family)
MILITGATGTVGSEVVKRLSVQGIHARALTRDVAKWRRTSFHMLNLSKATSMTPIPYGGRARAGSRHFCCLIRPSVRSIDRLRS